MSRIRSVKPEWLDDEALQESSGDARALSVALMLLADDDGNGRGGEVHLHARVFPGKPVKVYREAMARLIEIRYVSLYKVDGQTFFHIRNFLKHQKIDKPGKGKVPPPPENIRGSSEKVIGDTENEVDGLAPRARPLPSPPDPIQSPPEGEAVEPPEPETSATVVPLDLVARAEKVNIPEQFAREYDEPIEAVRWQVRETLSFWSIGPGMGQKRKNWMRVVRSRLHELGKAKRLTVGWPSPEQTTLAPSDRAIAALNRRNEQAAREAADALKASQAVKGAPPGGIGGVIKNLASGMGS